MNVRHTRGEKGLTITIRVTAYDNGMVAVDGVPINESLCYEQGHGWLGAAETITITLSEFRRQAIAGQKTIRRTRSSDQTVQSVQLPGADHNRP